MMKARLTKGKSLLFGCAMLGLFALPACNPKPQADVTPQPGDQIVARLNGAEIWASDVRREAAAQGLIGQNAPLDVTAPTFHQVLDQVVDQKLLAAEAVKRGLDKDEAMQRRLAAARDRVLGDALLEGEVQRATNERAVSALYHEMQKTASPTQEVDVRHLVLNSQAEADQVKRQLTAGAGFDALAAQRSIEESTRFKGGKMAPSTLDLLPDGYAAAFRAASPGELVGPFKSGSGWVVARLEARREGQPIPFAVARPQIIRFLTYDRVKDLVLNLHRAAKVEMLIAPPAASAPASLPNASVANKP